MTVDDIGQTQQTERQVTVHDIGQTQQTECQVSSEKKQTVVSVDDDEPPHLVKAVSEQKLDVEESQAVPKFLLVEFSQVTQLKWFCVCV